MNFKNEGKGKINKLKGVEIFFFFFLGEKLKNLLKKTGYVSLKKRIKLW